MHQRQRQVEFLSGAAAEHCYRGVLVLLVPQSIHQLPRTPQVVDAVRCGEVVEVLCDSQRLVEDDLLRAIAQPAVQRDTATIWTQLARQDLEQRGLPSPVFADDANERAGRDTEAHVPKHSVATPA